MVLSGVTEPVFQINDREVTPCIERYCDNIVSGAITKSERASSRMVSRTIEE